MPMTEFWFHFFFSVFVAIKKKTAFRLSGTLTRGLKGLFSGFSRPIRQVSEQVLQTEASEAVEESLSTP